MSDPVLLMGRSKTVVPWRTLLLCREGIVDVFVNAEQGLKVVLDVSSNAHLMMTCEREEKRSVHGNGNFLNEFVTIPPPRPNPAHHIPSPP